MAVRMLTLAGTGVALIWLSACATTPPPPTLDQAQCQAIDWTAQGQRDAAAGHGTARMERHAEACAPYGIVPDPAAYRVGHLEGRRSWCVPVNGFRLGRRGSTYNQGYCPADLEPAYMEAIADGRTVYDARQHAQRLQIRADETRSRADRLSSDIRSEESALGAEGLTDDARSAIRLRIRNLRSERDQLLDEASRQQSQADEANYDAARIANRFTPLYGG